MQPSADDPVNVVNSSKIVFLDFDGVVVQSNEIKDDAFEVMFREICPRQFDLAWAYHKANDAVPREEKFKHIIREVVGLREDPEELRRLVRRFEDLTFHSICQCEEVPGVSAFLQNLHGQKSVVLLSATPQASLESILRFRKIDRYFGAVFGAPVDKASVLREVTSAEAVPVTECVFIGDSKSDWQAAVSAGVHFIGMAGHFDFPVGAVSVVENFLRFSQVFNERIRN